MDALCKCMIIIKFTIMHLADTFIQSDLQCIQAIHLYCQYEFPGNRTHNLCAANAMLQSLSHRNTYYSLIIETQQSMKTRHVSKVIDVFQITFSCLLDT